MTNHQHDATRAITALCNGGEWACAHGNYAGLRDVARRLEQYVPEVVDDLHHLETACEDDLDHASEIWVAIERKIASAPRS